MQQLRKAAIYGEMMTNKNPPVVCPGGERRKKVKVKYLAQPRNIEWKNKGVELTRRRKLVKISEEV
jgi:hypothetical protein